MKRCLLIIKVLFLVSFLLFHFASAAKTKRVLMGVKDFMLGEHERTFVNEEGHLRLSYGFEKLLDVKKEMIWDIYADDSLFVVAFGGQKGGIKAFSYDKVQKKVGDQIFSADVVSTEMTKIASDGKGHFYVGSGAKGKIFYFNKNSSELKTLISLPVDFIWDLHYDRENNRLYAATGSKKAEVYAISFQSPESANQEAKLMASFDESNATKMVMDGHFLYVATNQKGKIYRMSLLDVKKKPVVVYDALYKDVSDFFIDGDYIYLSTAGEESRVKSLGASRVGGGDEKQTHVDGKNSSNSAEGRDGRLAKSDFSANKRRKLMENRQSMPPVNYSREKDHFLSMLEKQHLSHQKGEPRPRKQDMRDLKPHQISSVAFAAPFQNNVVRLNKNSGSVQVLASFPGLSILSIGKIRARNEAYGNLPKKDIALYVAFVEKGQIVTLDPQTLEVKMLHYDDKVGISAVAQHANGEIFLSAANGGEVYRLGPKLPQKGRFVSQIFALESVLEYGQVEILNYSNNDDVQVYLRSGVRYEIDKSWSEWKLVYEGSKEGAEAKISEHSTAMGKENTHRFVQFALDLKKRNDVSPAVGALRFSYAAPNTPPILYDFFVEVDQKNGFLKDRPQRPQELQSALGKLGLFRHIFHRPTPLRYKLSWKIFDEDDDIIRYDIFYRKSSSNQWISLMKNHYYPGLIFDSGLFFDGMYQFKVVYSDGPSNDGKNSFSREMRSGYMLFDHTAPRLEIVQSDSLVKIKAVDGWSEIKEFLYSFDGDVYHKLTPVDGVFDEKEEEFSLILPKNQKKLMMIVSDAHNNYSIKDYIVVQ